MNVDGLNVAGMSPEILAILGSHAPPRLDRLASGLFAR